MERVCRICVLLRLTRFGIDFSQINRISKWNIQISMNCFMRFKLYYVGDLTNKDLGDYLEQRIRQMGTLFLHIIEF